MTVDSVATLFRSVHGVCCQLQPRCCHPGPAGDRQASSCRAGPLGSDERGIGRKVQIHTRALRSKRAAAGTHTPQGGESDAWPGEPRCPDGGGPTCGGDAVKAHEGVEAGGCPRQHAGEPEGHEPTDTRFPFLRATERQHRRQRHSPPLPGPKEEPPRGPAGPGPAASPGQQDSGPGAAGRPNSRTPLVTEGPGNKCLSGQRPVRVITAGTQSMRMASDRKSHQLAETVSSKQYECPVSCIKLGRP